MRAGAQHEANTTGPCPGTGLIQTINLLPTTPQKGAARQTTLEKDGKP